MQQVADMTRQCGTYWDVRAEIVLAFSL